MVCHTEHQRQLAVLARGTYGRVSRQEWRTRKLNHERIIDRQLSSVTAEQPWYIAQHHADVGLLHKRQWKRQTC